MFRFGIKLGLATGAIYYVSEQGVWRGSDETVKLCNQICTAVSPYTNEIKKQIPYELPSLPQTNEVSYLAKHYWNKGVISTFGFLANIPTYVGEMTAKGFDSVMDNVEIKNLFVSTADTVAEK
ncbi:QIL1 [Carabus blaptoides fortunei]